MIKDLFEDRLLHWIEANNLFDDANRVLLAVSGGADSVAMAHVLVDLRKQGLLDCDFAVGHVNHCLRGQESDADEQFVIALADSLGVPVATKSVDVMSYAKEHKLSIETAGRQLRLQTLADMAEEHGCDCIATAHHKDDLAETMVHRLMRGTGFRGLCGIRPVSYIDDTEFVRPMLAVRRNEIIQYCKVNSIQWREDASNRNLGFTRNRIRHNLMPVLETESCEIVNKLQGLSHQCRRFQLLTEKLAQSIVSKGQFDQTADRFSIDQSHLKDTECWIFYEVVREVLIKLGIGLRPYTRAHFDMIYKLIGKKRTSRMLPNGLVVWALQDKLVFIDNKQSTDLRLYPDEPVRLEIGATVEFGPWRISSRILKADKVDLDRFMKTKDSQIEWFDADKISGPLTVRARRDGDRFRPIGSKGEKKVARFLQDGQLSDKMKKQAFIIADADKILWLAPIRMSEMVKISSQVNRICEVVISTVPEK